MNQSKIIKSIDRFRSYLFALSFFIISFPLLAISPQNEDGAEIVSTALQGGLLHSPGSPLQSWLDRIIVSFPGSNAVWKLSLLSLLVHCTAVFLMGEISKFLKLGLASAFFAVSVYAFFPSLWYLGVQPEKYALIGLFMVLGIYEYLRLKNLSADQMNGKEALRLGALGGLALCQHPLVVMVCPFFLLSVLVQLNNPVKKAMRVICVIAGLLVTTFIGYISLLILAKGSIWPNWGAISTIEDLVKFVFRGDFHNFAPLDLSTSMFREAGVLQLLSKDLVENFGFLGLSLPLVGLFFVIMRKKDRAFWAAALGTIVIALIVLLRVRISPDPLLTLSSAQRYQYPVVLCLALMGALGIEYLIEWLPRKVAPLARLLTPVIVIPLFFFNYTKCDAAKDLTADIFRHAVEASLPSDAIYLAGTHLEMFYGIHEADKLRFPIHLGLGWYFDRDVIYQIEPRLRVFYKKASGVPDVGIHGGPQEELYISLLRGAYEAGLLLMSSRRNELAQVASTDKIKKYGILFYITKNEHREFDELSAARRICRTLFTAPAHFVAQGHYHSLYLMQWFPTVFEASSASLKLSGGKDYSKLMQSIATSLSEDFNSDQWRQSCSQLIES